MPIMNNGGAPIRPNYLNTAPAKAGYGDPLPMGPNVMPGTPAKAGSGNPLGAIEGALPMGPNGGMPGPQQGAVAQRLAPQVNRTPAVAGYGDPARPGPARPGTDIV